MWGLHLRKSLVAHLADDVNHVRYGTASGANAKTVALSPAPASLVEGMALSFKNTIANTGAVSLNVSGLGAKPIIKSNGNALSSGNLKAGSIYTVRYSGTSFILQGEGGEYGTALASDVLSGKTIGTDSGIVTGTMQNRGMFNLPLGAIVPDGYYSGGTVPAGKRWKEGTVSFSISTKTSAFFDIPLSLDFVPATFLLVCGSVASFNIFFATDTSKVFISSGLTFSNLVVTDLHEQAISGVQKTASFFISSITKDKVRFNVSNSDPTYSLVMGNANGLNTTMKWYAFE